MIPVFLTKIKTGDGETLEGAVVLPQKKGDTALIWLHGLSSKFYSGQTLMKELAENCRKNNIAYFKFNNRGNNIVYRGSRNFLGSGFEKFTDCVSDIRAMTRFARRLGYKKIILVGHSTGANKALYYVYKNRDKSVKKIILLGGLSDLDAESKKIGKSELAKRVKIVENIFKKNSGSLVPTAFGLYSAQRYLSLYKPGSSEDVFPYYNSKADWKELKSVKIPLAVIIGKKDEHLTLSTEKFLEIFAEKAKQTEFFSGIIIKGADHVFHKKEKELSKTILDFIK